MSWFALAAGVCLSSAFIQLALGLAQPRHRENLTFAALMVIICLLQAAAAGLHGASSADEAIAYARYGAACAIVFMTILGIFVHQFTRLEVPRWLVVAFFAINGMWLLFDLISPRGILYAAHVGASDSTLPDDVTRAPLGAIQVAWHVFNTAIMLWVVAAGVRTARRGRARNGIALCIGAIALLAAVLVDTVRDVVGGSWPYMGGFGAMVMSTVLSVQLALDFRENERRLTSHVRNALRMRDELNTPLQILQLELELAARQPAVDSRALHRLQRAVDRLTALGRGLSS